MDDFAGKICPFCTENASKNPCTIPQHQEFWYEDHNQRVPLREVRNIYGKNCPSCGDILADGQIYCLKCGHKRTIPCDLSSRDLSEIFNGRRGRFDKLKEFPFSILISIALVAVIGYFVLLSVK